MFSGAISLLAIALSTLGPAGIASAAESKPYGEVARFGGVGDTPGKFVLPVGFTVDPGDGNAVYVLDRTIAHETGTGGQLDYRLQKISSTGSHEVLGSVTLPVENYAQADRSDAQPLISLAVDSAKHKVYALVESIVEDEAEGVPAFVPVARRLVAWSTQPNGSKELVAAPEYGVDPVTGAGLVAELPAPEPGKDLYAPAGLTVNGNHEVVVEAQQGVEAPAKGGHTILQPVIAEGSSKGKLGTPWVANTTIAPNNEQADGVFTATDGSGSLGIDLFEGEGKVSRLASVKPNFATPEASLIAADASGGINLDQAPTIDNRYTVNYNTNNEGQSSSESILDPYTAGSPIVQLVGSEHLYAARYGKAGGQDVQAELAPWNASGNPLDFWFTGHGEANGLGNEGIRLFDGAGHIATTIGGGTGGTCSLDSGRASLAAGSDGSLFALTQPEEEGRQSDNQVIEFAEGGAGACPRPSGAPRVVKGGTETGGKATVTQGVPVVFDAGSIDRAGGAPYEFDWNFEGQTSGGTAGTDDGYELGSKMQSPEYKWPSPEAEHVYTKIGTYKTTVRTIGDYGTNLFSLEVKVLSSTPQVAKFTAPSSVVAGQPAMFDASASEVSAPIVKYSWEFGDGATRETSGPQVSHTFAAPGAYTVELTLTEEDGETTEPASQLVTVTASSEEKPPPPPEEKPPTGTGPTVTTPNTILPITPIVKPIVKPPTNAQKLAAALKACTKKKSKKQRASCEKQERKRYAVNAKHKSTKKKSTKRK